MKSHALQEQRAFFHSLTTKSCVRRWRHMLPTRLHRITYHRITNEKTVSYTATQPCDLHIFTGRLVRTWASRWWDRSNRQGSMYCCPSPGPCVRPRPCGVRTHGQWEPGICVRSSVRHFHRREVTRTRRPATRKQAFFCLTQQQEALA